MIDFANYEDVPRLKHIWKVCFQDEDRYISLFFMHRFLPSQSLVYRENGQAVSMVFLLPVRIQLGGSFKPAHYIYAAATLPEYRGRGLMRRLLNQALQIAAGRRQVYSILVPGEKSLFDYYQRLGYHTSFYIKTVRVSRQEIGDSSFELIACDASVMAAAAERILSARAYAVLWDELAMEYVCRETAYFGGSVIGFSGESGPGYAVVLPGQDRVYVKEVMCYESDLPRAMATIARVFPAPRFTVRLPVDSRYKKGIAEIRPFGMIRQAVPAALPPKGSPAYLNLVLD